MTTRSAAADYRYIVKLLLLGDAGVGKSCLLKQLMDGQFEDSYVPTIGMDFSVKTIKVQDQSARVQIWDSAGQPRFQTVIRSFYRGPHAFVVVCDVTEASSYESVDKWIKSIKDHGPDEAPIMLMGSKVDLSAQRVVSEEMMMEKAQKYGMQYFETSAKDSTNVEKAFRALTEECVAKDRFFSSLSSRLKIDSSPSPSSASCCVIQ